MSSIVYKIGSPQLASEIFGYKNIQLVTEDEINHTSVFGLPVFMPLTIDELSYPIDGKVARISALTIESCIVEINGSKEIIKTAILGRPGTVKEYITMGDYNVSIKGVLFNDKLTDNRFPKHKQQWLNEFIKAPKQISITHGILNNVGVYDLVIESFNFPATPGYENLCAFELQCVSDLPIELVIKKEAV